MKKYLLAAYVASAFLGLKETQAQSENLNLQWNCRKKHAREGSIELIQKCLRQGTYNPASGKYFEKIPKFTRTLITKRYLSLEKEDQEKIEQALIEGHQSDKAFDVEPFFTLLRKILELPDLPPDNEGLNLFRQNLMVRTLQYVDKLFDADNINSLIKRSTRLSNKFEIFTALSLSPKEWRNEEFERYIVQADLAQMAFETRELHRELMRTHLPENKRIQDIDWEQQEDWFQLFQNIAREEGRNISMRAKVVIDKVSYSIPQIAQKLAENFAGEYIVKIGDFRRQDMQRDKKTAMKYYFISPKGNKIIVGIESIRVRVRFHIFNEYDYLEETRSEHTEPQRQFLIGFSQKNKVL